MNLEQFDQVKGIVSGAAPRVHIRTHRPTDGDIGHLELVAPDSDQAELVEAALGALSVLNNDYTPPAVEGKVPEEPPVRLELRGISKHVGGKLMVLVDPEFSRPEITE